MSERVVKMRAELVEQRGKAHETQAMTPVGREKATRVPYESDGA